MNTNNSHDSHETIFPADPRITAYAFGELEGDELKLIEAAVNADPMLQQAVAELRGFGGQLATALGDEPSAPMVEPTALGDRGPPSEVPKKGRGLVIPFPLHYLATAAAACFAVVVWVRQETTKESQRGDVSGPEAVAFSAVEPTASKEVPEPGTMPRVAVDSGAIFEPPAAEVKFDQSLALGDAKNANARAVQAPPESQAYGQFIQDEKQQAELVAKGRSQYLAGDQTGAGATFDTVLAMNPQSPEAKAFKSRIEKENAAIGELNRVRTRSQLLEVVSNSWQRPSNYPASPAPSAAPVSATVDVAYKSENVFRGASLANSNGLMGGFDQDRLNVSNEAYSLPADNVYRSVEAEPLSTFSIDVDTASYSNVRRFINGGRLPPRDAVRVEELINYFPYRYAPPKGDVPFAAKLEVASAPWAPEHRLVRIGLKAREVSMVERKPANLVFLIDVSGSMNSANKLPLVKESLRLLVERLRPDDRVAIVTYAGSSGLALPSTPASRKGEILASLDNLNAGGSTNGAMGIHLAYDIAKANFVAGGGINRVILCTDGDFNVGVTDRGQLTTLIEEKATHRVFLSVFGFGMGNYKDATLEMLSGKGNGTYGYIDSRREAEKVFVEQVEGTLVTIAKDVKIQVEFNPAKVRSYRLIGYENRMLAKEDFNNDAVDAGDIGAGHTVTALYEVVPVGVGEGGGKVDPLKYQRTESGGRTTEDRGRRTESEELLTVKIRYKAPEGDVSKKQEFPLMDRGGDFAQADGEFKFAAAVAAWGMLLRDSPHKGSATFEQVSAWAEDGLGDDAGGHRAEFVQLVRRSAELE